MAEHGIAPATFTEKDRAELAAKVAKRAGAEPAEPTFTLAEIVGVFGSNYDVGYYTPIGRLALEALDDAMRTISCAYEALDVLGDDADAGNALYNCKCRLEVAQNLLNKLPGVKLDRPAAEVQS